LSAPLFAYSGDVPAKRTVAPDAATNGGRLKGADALADCVFCAQHQGRALVVGGAIFQDALLYAHHFTERDGPSYLGHLMIESKRHIRGVEQATDREASALGVLVARLSRALVACTGAERVYVESYGEVVPHLHVHLTARYPGLPPEYLRWNATEWPAAPRGGPEDVAALAARLREALSGSAAAES
jgi:histidine triad (HIT) family protein